MERKRTSLDTVCAALSEIMGIEPPKMAAKANEDLVQYAKTAFDGGFADRIFMYNPDAVAQWIAEKYGQWYLQEVEERTELRLPLESVMPSVTPVCFATMYTGTQPEVHGIRKYEKPVVTTDSIFDALLRAGKKCAIVSYGNSSMSKIFLEREMDYYLCDSVPQANARAAELILRDEHDFIAVYNGNYDGVMHKDGPEGARTLAELRCNSETFAMLDDLITANWQKHNTLVAFAMDHGCHEIDDNCGSHGLDMPEDLHICHYYRAYRAKND